MTADRVAALEATINAAMAELQLLKAGGKAVPPPPPVQPPPPRDEVRILQLNNELTTGMPTLREMERLFSTVKALSPWPSALHDRFDEHRPFRGFATCFRWLMNVPRADRPNGRVSMSYWHGVCRTWLRARNSVASDLDANAMLLAVFAAGDICFCPANAQLGTVWEIGILEFGGKPADATAWRRILTQGAAAVLPPSVPARRLPMPSNVRITVGY